MQDLHTLSALDVVYITDIIQLSLNRSTVSAEVKSSFEAYSDQVDFTNTSTLV